MMTIVSEKGHYRMKGLLAMPSHSSGHVSQLLSSPKPIVQAHKESEICYLNRKTRAKGKTACTHTHLSVQIYSISKYNRCRYLRKKTIS